MKPRLNVTMLVISHNVNRKLQHTMRA